MHKMDIKREQEDSEPVAEGKHWFEVPVNHDSNSQLLTYIKQEVTDEAGYTFENIVTDPTIITLKSDTQLIDIKTEFIEDIKYPFHYEHPQQGCSHSERVNRKATKQSDINFPGVDFKEKYVEDTISQSIHEDSQSGCSHSECNLAIQLIPATTAMTYSASVGLPERMLEVQEPYDEIQIDNQHIKKELGVYEPITNIVSRTAVRQQIQSNVKDPASLVAVIKLDKKSFNNKNFVCSFCFDFFSSLSLLKLHKACHKKSITDKTEDYKSIRSNLSNQNLNLINHSEEKPIKCVQCNYSCKTSSQMKLHKMNHSGEKPFSCDQCNYSCITSSSMKSHKMTHSGEKPFICDQCNYSCILSSNMKLHKMTHSGERPFKCDQCNYSCITSVKMKRHKMIHSGEKPFKCVHCNYSSITSRSMKIHKMTHSGEKPFKCAKCDYSSKTYSHMKVHKSTHSGEKPFKCDQCDYSCIQPGAIKIHKMIHSGEKLFQCEKCNYSCIRSGDMKRHKMTHSDEKQYKCEQCNYSCIRSGDMKRHKMTHSSKSYLNITNVNTLV